MPQGTVYVSSGEKMPFMKEFTALHAEAAMHLNRNISAV
jgi:hypothetical protein